METAFTLGSNGPIGRLLHGARRTLADGHAPAHADRRIGVRPGFDQPRGNLALGKPVSHADVRHGV
jgi:hypothetical protein